MLLFELMVKTGLRPSKAAALRPGDIDLKRRRLHVERALDTNGRVKSTKTHEARNVDLSSGLINWLFANQEGKPLDEAKTRKVFKASLERIGLPTVCAV